MIKRLIILGMFLAFTVSSVEAEQLALAEFKEVMRKDFIQTRDTYTKELAKDFRKAFMKEISSELRTLIRS